MERFFSSNFLIIIRKYTFFETISLRSSLRISTFYRNLVYKLNFYSFGEMFGYDVDSLGRMTKKIMI